MSDKRIIELDVTDVVEADDFLAIDSVSGTTRRIKPIKIGATYEIEDGDHSFTLVGSNGYSHTVDIPYDSVSMTQAEYDALTPAQKADGTARFITDAESDVESELWSKVGRQTLDTDSQVLSNAVNELKGSIDTNTDDINTNTEAISELESSSPKYYLATADVNCTNTASNSWGYWGYTTIDLSQVLADKTLLAIVPQLCTLRGDPAVIGLMSFTYTANNYNLIPRVNFKNSGTFSVQFLIIYK